MKSIAFHSSKGGSGKTFLVANIGKVLASKGKKCIIIDCDVVGPSFNTIFSSKTNTNFYINDILLGKCSVSEAIYQSNIENLDIIFANPSPIMGEGLLAFEHATHVNALRNLSQMGLELHNLNYDILLLDTTPGLNPLSVNALLVTQSVVLAVRPDSYSLKTTNHILRTIYTRLRDSAVGSKNYFIVFNQVPNASSEEIETLLTAYIEELRKNLNINVLGHIPCLCRELGSDLIRTPLLKEGQKGLDIIASLTKKLVEN
ncbi:MAG: ParA family protein [Candidatus Hermodarchaeota archaeon]